jgi:O-methyltransferase
MHEARARIRSLAKRGLLGRVRRRLAGGTEDPAVMLERQLAELEPGDRQIVGRALPFTMTGVPRLQALVDAVRYCVGRGVPGGFAECGVWRGGSVLAMIHTLQSLDRSDRDIYLYDTFTGMTEPTELDRSPYYPPAVELWEETAGRPFPEFFAPELFNEEEVKRVVLATGYPEGRIHFVRGPVEETLPANAPGALALLRLDTDRYESTRHELVHLYPLLSEGGVLIVDDYGHWDGARRAVDEYFASEAPQVLLNRIDYAGRIAVKV